MADDKTITQEGLTRLLSWLDPDSESAAASRYETIRTGLIRVFTGRGCFEPEMLADRTIDRVSQKVLQWDGEYEGEPERYFYGVAKNIFREWLRQQKTAREAEIPEAIADGTGDVETEYRCLEECLENLTGNLRQITVEYYGEEKRAKINRRRELAEKLGISDGALHTRMSRVRASLADCVMKCLAEN